MKYARTFEELTAAKDSLDAPKREEATRFGIEVSSALLSNPEAAIAMMENRAIAAENSGLMDEAASLRSAIDKAKTDPRGQAVSNLILLQNSGAIPAETTKLILENAGFGGDIPESFRTLELRADAAGLVKGTPEYDKFMVSGGKGPETTVTNVLGDAEGSFARELAKTEAAQIMKTIEAGQAASRNLVELDNLSALLGQVDTGGTAAVKSWLGETFGIATEGLNDIQAFEATIARMIPAQRVEGSGSSSNLDVQQFAKGLPALIKQPGGNQIIIETLRDINDYDVAASIIAGQVAEWARTPAADRPALEEQGLILSPAKGRKAIMDLGSPTSTYKSFLKEKPKTKTQPVVIDGVIIQKVE
jgi:hypothetical protein